VLEIHNVSVPPPRTRHRGLSSPYSFERFSNLRIRTVTNVEHMAGASCLPALPVSVRSLTLDAGGVADSLQRCGSHRCMAVMQ